jgi:hypothetical protein
MAMLPRGGGSGGNGGNSGGGSGPALTDAKFTITEQNITNKYLTLPKGTSDPAKTILMLNTDVQYVGTDYEVL